METPLFINDGQFMLLIDSIPVGNDDSYLHIKRIDVNVSSIVPMYVVLSHCIHSHLIL